MQQSSGVEEFIGVIQVRPIQDQDREWVRSALLSVWDTLEFVSRGRVHQADRLPGFVGETGGRRVGVLTYCIDPTPQDCELVCLSSLEPGKGVGAALVNALTSIARDKGCQRIWLVTYNDNFEALRFYQRRGFHLAALHRGAVDHARRLRPAIPLVGANGIRLRDEIELELLLPPTEGGIGT